MDSGRVRNVRFAYATSLLVGGNQKQRHKPKTLLEMESYKLLQLGSNVYGLDNT
jgi:hypothetical protein